ncbi:hypothetical protein NSP_40580 [Nodularia spumigena CCY9414]|nr:hypothetical protein NSP_40580 [Nodularia spumigena CCY9414]
MPNSLQTLTGKVFCSEYKNSATPTQKTPEPPLLNTSTPTPREILSLS